MPSSEEKDSEKAPTLTSDDTAKPVRELNLEVGDSEYNTNSILRDILQKVTNLEEMNKKVDVISQKVCSIEKKMEAYGTRIVDLEKGYEFLECEFEEIKMATKDLQEKKADKEYVDELRKSIVDLVNRSKRNNVVLHGIPEGEEGDAYDCGKYVTTFFASHLKETVEVERAHRTPSGRKKEGNDRPRPIHVRLLRFTDREKLLKRSADLKDVKIKGKKIGMSDDVHKDTREEHKQLMAKVKELRKENKFAFVPYSVPRVIKYKNGPKDSAGSLKTLRVEDLK